MANTNPEPPSLEDLLYVLNHVFLPPKLPQKDDNDTDTDRDVVLCHLVSSASREFATFLPQPQQKKWSIVTEMLKNLLESTGLLDIDVLVTKIAHLEDGGQ
jgi:hypothetical protein